MPFFQRAGVGVEIILEEGGRGRAHRFLESFSVVGDKDFLKFLFSLINEVHGERINQFIGKQAAGKGLFTPEENIGGNPSYLPGGKKFGQKGLLFFYERRTLLRQEIEKVFIQLGGKKIKTESFDNKKVIIIELSSKKLKELFEKLKLIGEVKEGRVVLEEQKGDIRIGIEIVGISDKK